MRHYGNPLVAVLPAGVLLAGSLSFARHDSFFVLAPFFGVTLLLLGATTQYFREHRWLRKGIDFAEDLRTDVGTAVGVLSVGLVVLAAFAPFFSIRQINQWLGRGRSQNAGL